MGEEHRYDFIWMDLAQDLSQNLWLSCWLGLFCLPSSVMWLLAGLPSSIAVDWRHHFLAAWASPRGQLTQWQLVSPEWVREDGQDGSHSVLVTRYQKYIPALLLHSFLLKASKSSPLGREFYKVNTRKWGSSESIFEAVYQNAWLSPTVTSKAQHHQYHFHYEILWIWGVSLFVRLSPLWKKEIDWNHKFVLFSF